MKNLIIKSIVAASIIFFAIPGTAVQVFAQNSYSEGYSVSSEPYITGGYYSEGYSVSSDPYITGGSYSEGYSVSSEPYITGGSYSEGYSVSSEPYITGGYYSEGYSVSSEPYIVGGSYSEGYSVSSEPYITGGYYDPGYSSPYITGGYYDSGYSYNSTPSWTGYTYDSGYSYSGYSYPSYTYTSYTSPTTVTPPVVVNRTCSYSSDPNARTFNNNYPTCTKVCTNGSTVAATTACPAPTPAPQQCIRPMIYDPNVARYNEDYPACTKVCTNGSTVAANASCPNIVTPPVTCPAGTQLINGVCQTITLTPPVVPPVTCPSGTQYVNGVCQQIASYQTCWDGSRIPLGSVCPAQYKVCANGTSIPVNQTCYVGNTYIPYTPPAVVKFNNAITSVATEITLSSARCNGIGLIASGAQSTGWFEYGETANLGRETAKANIGTLATAPFSNVLANLKPTTTYYCRAVMQNQYGIVKGEIVSFTTKGKAVSYVKPVTKTTTKVTPTKTKTNQIVCVDGSVVTLGSKSSADLINAGQKLVSLQIEKVSGSMQAGSQVSYRLSMKNLSDEVLRGMTVKVTIPQEMTLTNASIGQYDPTMRVLTLSGVTLAAYGETSVSWTATLAPTSQVGKTLAITAYTSYEVPGSDVQDEVSAYIVGTVVPGTDGSVSNGDKKLIGAADGRSFLPGSLVEWLALIAIIFIIFILARSVYNSYKGDKNTSHH